MWSHILVHYESLCRQMFSVLLNHPAVFRYFVLRSLTRDCSSPCYCFLSSSILSPLLPLITSFSWQRCLASWTLLLIKLTSSVDLYVRLPIYPLQIHSHTLASGGSGGFDCSTNLLWSGWPSATQLYSEPCHLRENVTALHCAEQVTGSVAWSRRDASHSLVGET